MIDYSDKEKKNSIFDLTLKDQKMFGMDNKIDCIVRKFLDTTAENNYELTTRSKDSENLFTFVRKN